VIKDEDLFFLSNSAGDVPLNNVEGYGLYYHDCRFLKGYQLRIGGVPANALASASEHGFMSEFVLTNPDLQESNDKEIKKQKIGICWRRIIQAKDLTLRDVIEFTNYSHSPIECVLAFDFAAGFEDIFEIRGLHPSKIGRPEKPSWNAGELVFEYDGADGIFRSLGVLIQPTPLARGETGADLTVKCAANETKQVHVSLIISESTKKQRPLPKRPLQTDPHELAGELRNDSDQWLDGYTKVESNSRRLNETLQRSLRDLRVLRAALDGHEYFSAGLPWYGALFGRDSIISSLQTLAFRPSMAEHTLRLLAKYQGQEVNDFRDEQPGKILHELRVGELAHLNEIPQTPYYGAVDSTPLFLILLARHASWTGELSLFNELKANVEKAFEWISRYGDESGDGYLEYSSKSSHGLGNQGWKDSGDAIVNSDGTLCKPPIALVEVQGYVYLAKTSMAELYERSGDSATARRLQAEAQDLQRRFERDFWLEDKKIYALALQAGKKPADVVSSNPGQMLWSGMADPVRASETVERLMSQEMFNGWGVRTLSSSERRYNPVGYHLGTVWPHDNSIIAAGFRRYGFDEAAFRICSGIVEAASHFPRCRLPEVFAGFSKQQFPTPVRYPVACHPQAWAAGSVPFMIESLLGLEPKAFENKLEIVRPILPDSVRHLELRGVKIGASSVDVRFERQPNGEIVTEVIKVQGAVKVDVLSGVPVAA
jgi:glycogen debranching enzyme